MHSTSSDFYPRWSDWEFAIPVLIGKAPQSVERAASSYPEKSANP